MVAPDRAEFEYELKSNNSGRICGKNLGNGKTCNMPEVHPWHDLSQGEKHGRHKFEPRPQAPEDVTFTLTRSEAHVLRKLLYDNVPVSDVPHSVLHKLSAAMFPEEYPNG